MIAREVRTRLRDIEIVAVSSTLIARGLSVSLQFLLNIVLSRLLGPAGLASYFLYVSWLNLLTSIEGFGLPVFALRRLGSLLTRKQMNAAYSFWRGSMLFSFIVTIVVAIVIYIFRVPLAHLLLDDADLAYILRLVALSSIPFTLLTLATAILKAQMRPILSTVLQFAIVPVLLVAYSVILLLTQSSISVVRILTVYAIALVIALVVSIVIVHREFIKDIAHSASEALQSSSAKQIDLSQIFEFWLVSLLVTAVSNLPFFLLPHFSTSEEIGLFGVANRLVGLAALIQVALSTVYSPLFVEAKERRDPYKLKLLLRQTQLYSLVTYLPVLMLIIFKSNWLLGLFGSEFTEARIFLYILAVGQLANSATGIVSHFNLMTGDQKFELKATVVSLIVAAILSVALGIEYGAVGVAVALATSVAGKNILSYLKAQSSIKTLAQHSIV